MKEDKCETLDKYLESLKLEISGHKSFMKQSNHDGEFITLLSILQYFIDNPNEKVEIYKREVFKGIDVIKKLKDKYM